MRIFGALASDLLCFYISLVARRKVSFNVIMSARIKTTPNAISQVANVITKKSHDFGLVRVPNNEKIRNNRKVDWMVLNNTT
jgi:beta-xylosidase